MNRFCKALGAFSVIALAISLSACGSSATPTPSPAGTPSKVETPAAPISPQPTSAAKATLPPAATATATPKPAATSTPASAASVSDLVAKAKATTEYSFDIKIDAAGQTMTGKSYVKGTKMRQEMNVAGQNTVLLLNMNDKVAYTLMPDQGIAMKMDFSKVSVQTERPDARISELPSSAKLIGTDTVDGKAAAVYEVPDSVGSGKYWVWTERGMPLKVEVTGAEGKTVIEFLNYKFGSIPDSLFELPSGTQLMDLPINPNLPGANP